MLIHVSIEFPVMPDWIYKRGFSQARLLDVWYHRAQTHAEILAVEYLPAPSPWKIQYRSVNCSGKEYALT